MRDLKAAKPGDAAVAIHKPAAREALNDARGLGVFSEPEALGDLAQRRRALLNEVERCDQRHARMFAGAELHADLPKIRSMLSENRTLRG